jgi:RNA recognition motif-containing protein
MPSATPSQRRGMMAFSELTEDEFATFGQPPPLPLAPTTATTATSAAAPASEKAAGPAATSAAAGDNDDFAPPAGSAIFIPSVRSLAAAGGGGGAGGSSGGGGGGGSGGGGANAAANASANAALPPQRNLQAPTTSASVPGQPPPPAANAAPPRRQGVAEAAAAAAASLSASYSQQRHAIEQEEAAAAAAGDSGSGECGHLFRLFVGWVPKDYTQADLVPLFEPAGRVRDAMILRDRITGAPRGCAFVSFATREEAELAVARLDRRVHLPGAMSPLEVRFARSHQYVQAGAGPQDNRQLFFSNAPARATDADMRALFAQHGTVEEIVLFRDRRTRTSKGCGFVTMGSREQAITAMEALDERPVPGFVGAGGGLSSGDADAGAGPSGPGGSGHNSAPAHAVSAGRNVVGAPDSGTWSSAEENYIAAAMAARQHAAADGTAATTATATARGAAGLASGDNAAAAAAAHLHLHHHHSGPNSAGGLGSPRGAPALLSVRWADPDLQLKKRRAVEDSNAETRTLFFAKIARTANEDDVSALFSRHGRVDDVNLFRAFQGAPTTKGCGLITMGSHADAEAAIAALDGRYKWAGTEAGAPPMVVKWMDGALQRRRREEHLAAMRQGLVPSMSMGGDIGSGAKAGVGGGGGGMSSGASTGAAFSAAGLGGLGGSGNNPLVLQLLSAGLGGPAGAFTSSATSTPAGDGGAFALLSQPPPHSGGGAGAAFDGVSGSGGFLAGAAAAGGGGVSGSGGGGVSYLPLHQQMLLQPPAFPLPPTDPRRRGEMEAMAAAVAAQLQLMQLQQQQHQQHQQPALRGGAGFSPPFPGSHHPPPPRYSHLQPLAPLGPFPDLSLSSPRANVPMTSTGSSGGAGGGAATTDQPPPGCAPDAYKLFVGNVPRSCTEAELMSLLSAVGPVIELVVMRDPHRRLAGPNSSGAAAVGGGKRGAALVWYATRQAADAAVAALNGRHVLMSRAASFQSAEDLSAEPPLVVRRANSRCRPVGGGGGGAGAAAATGSAAASAAAASAAAAAAAAAASTAAYGGAGAAMQPGSPHMAAAAAAALPPYGGSGGGSGAYPAPASPYAAAMVGVSGSGGGWFGNGDPSSPSAGPAEPAAAAAATLTLSLDPQRAAAVLPTLASVQRLSGGAQVSVVAAADAGGGGHGAAGDGLALQLSGTRAQVDAAHSIVSSML